MFIYLFIRVQEGRFNILTYSYTLHKTDFFLIFPYFSSFSTIFRTSGCAEMPGHPIYGSIVLMFELSGVSQLLKQSLVFKTDNFLSITQFVL